MTNQRNVTLLKLTYVDKGVVRQPERTGYSSGLYKAQPGRNSGNSALDVARIVDRLVGVPARHTRVLG